MAFPSSPTDGQIHTVGDRAFQWNATLGAWKRYANNGTINWQQYKYSRIETNITYLGSESPKDIGLSCTITLSNAANKVLIVANLCGHNITPTAYQWVHLLKNGASLAYLNRVHEATASTTGIYIDAPNSVGPLTYNINLVIEGAPTDTGELNLGNYIGSSLLLAELKA